MTQPVDLDYMNRYLMQLNHRITMQERLAAPGLSPTAKSAISAAGSAGNTRLTALEATVANQSIAIADLQNQVAQLWYVVMNPPPADPGPLTSEPEG